MNMIYLIDR